MGHMGLHLLLSHVHQVQLGHIGDDADSHRHQPETVTAVLIMHLYKQSCLDSLKSDFMCPITRYMSL